MEEAPLIVNLSGDFPDTRLALLTRDLKRDLSREGIDPRTVEATSVPERIGKLATLGTLAVTLVTSGAVRALIGCLKAYLAREPSRVIKLTRPDGMQVEVNAHNVAAAGVLLSNLTAGRIKLGDLRAETGDAAITNLKAEVARMRQEGETVEAARMAEERLRSSGPSRNGCALDNVNALKSD